ncbi:MAG TPA: hypothetical protein VLA19_01805 [Herpetosiphonaceae bacterium]|nr:hypothetical protein [Herpetosiphonaceae bacterium]
MYTGLAPRTIVDVARETEAAGWDGFFIWDAFLSDIAWVLLATAAMVTGCGIHGDCLPSVAPQLSAIPARAASRYSGNVSIGQ